MAGFNVITEVYAKQWSIWLDFKIIARTVALVLTGRD
jgi:lipopolysaccharide/colanic/teichoic acid biosynthesis glycosyltransferase